MKLAKILALSAVCAILMSGCACSSNKEATEATMSPTEGTYVVTEAPTEPDVASTSEDAIKIAKEFAKEKYGNKFDNHKISTVQDDLTWYVYFDPTESTSKKTLEIDVLKKTGEINFFMVE